ncbi:MAG: hypothetical protein N2Z74_00980 [Syntrophales bacterium]|nr:hypothetical protein [Syntrophales bacterium]
MFKPVDTQQSIAQIPVSEKVQQIQQQHADLQQRHFALQFNAERKRLKEKIRDSEEAEGLRLRDEQQKGRSGKERDRREAHQGAAATATPGVRTPEDGIHIDIKV